jgi:putative transposase
MPRRHRIVPPNSILHVTNRGNDRRVIFPESVDYGSFLVLLREARERYVVELYAYCLMPNHFHLVVRAKDRDEISAYMHYVEREHACDLRACARSRGWGHVFQRRYWHRIVERDGPLFTVMRYVEANPVRAGLVEWGHEWEWSSLWDRTTGERDLLHPSPVRLPDDWPTIVTVPMQAVDLEAIRHPVRRGRPSRPVDLRIAKK